jgi:hypothetical protein
MRTVTIVTSSDRMQMCVAIGQEGTTAARCAGWGEAAGTQVVQSMQSSKVGTHLTVPEMPRMRPVMRVLPADKVPMVAPPIRACQGWNARSTGPARGMAAHVRTLPFDTVVARYR